MDFFGQAIFEHENDSYFDRCVANSRFHCTCGRFVKSETVRIVHGAYEWDCSRCGPTREV